MNGEEIWERSNSSLIPHLPKEIAVAQVPRSNHPNLSCLIPHLPNEIAINCIARVPRSNHPKLSSVSRSWRSLLRSPLFYTVRSQLNINQSFLYITLRDSSDWFVLDPHANKLSPLPPPPFPTTRSACAVLGPQIFFVGGSEWKIPSPNVWIFDTRFNQWEMGPRMKVSRECALAVVINGKIYVLGGCLVDVWNRSSSWVEVFDPSVGSWAPLSIPIDFDFQYEWLISGAVLDGKLFANVLELERGFVFDPSAGVYGNVSIELLKGWQGDSTGWQGSSKVVDGIWYCYDAYQYLIKWYNVKENKWEEVKMIEKERKMLKWHKHIFRSALAEIGGRLYLVWGGFGTDVWGVYRVGTIMKIGYLRIEVSRENDGGLRGRVVQSDVLFTFTKISTNVVHCLGVGL